MNGLNQLIEHLQQDAATALTKRGRHVLELGHWQIPDGLIQVQGLEPRIHHKPQRQVPPDARFGLQLTIFRSQELLDLLMQRFNVPTMTAHLDDLRGIPGQVSGETLDRFTLPVRVVIDDRHPDLAIFLDAYDTGKDPVGLLLAVALECYWAVGCVGPRLGEGFTVEGLPLSKHPPRLLDSPPARACHAAQ